MESRLVGDRQGGAMGSGYRLRIRVCEAHDRHGVVAMWAQDDTI